MNRKTWLITTLLAFLTLTPLLARAQTPCTAKDYDCQIKGLEARIRTDPRDTEAYYSLGVALQNVGGHARAVGVFDQYLSLGINEPQYRADAYSLRAFSQRKLGRGDLAVNDSTKAIELFPANAEYYVERGNAYNDLKQFEAAATDFTKAIGLKKDFRSAHFGRGYSYMERKIYPSAVVDFTTAIGLDPSEGEAYYNRGTIYYRTQAYVKAIADLTRYIDLNKAHEEFMSDGYQNRGLAYLYSGNPTKAVADFTKAIELDPKSKSAYESRAEGYRKLNKIALAVADEKKAAELPEQ